MDQGGMKQGGSGPTPRRRPGDKPFIPFARFEDVVVKCGHVEKFGLLPEGKDRFRNDRRKKLMSRDCKECRTKRHTAEQAAIAVRQAEKELRKSQAGEKPARLGKPPQQLKGRLPTVRRFESHL